MNRYAVLNGKFILLQTDDESKAWLTAKAHEGATIRDMSRPEWTGKAEGSYTTDANVVYGHPDYNYTFLTMPFYAGDEPDFVN